MNAAEPDSFRASLMKVIPDEPVWIEARSVLLDPQSRLFGTPGGFVIRSDAWRLAAIGGNASESLIRRALSDIPAAGSDPAALWATVIPAGFTTEARRALPAWSPDDADIFQEPVGGLLPFASEERSSNEVRWLRPDEVELLEALPEELAAEVSEGLIRSEVAAAWIDGRPVSFCSIACQSERLWDVSIDTAPGYRQRGLAGECVRWLSAEMRKQGKRAVWGAHSENVASRRLAAKLGFEPSGRLCLFENWAGEVGDR